MVQVHAVATSWKFESSSGHQLQAKQLPLLSDKKTGLGRFFSACDSAITSIHPPLPAPLSPEQATQPNKKRAANGDPFSRSLYDSGKGMTQHDGFVAVRPRRDDIDRRTDHIFNTRDVSASIDRQLLQRLGTQGRLSPAQHLLVDRLQTDIAVSIGRRIDDRAIGILIADT